MLIDWNSKNAGEHKLMLKGEVGDIEAIIHLPENFSSKAILICCHPHPLYGGTMTNKIVHTICKTMSKIGVPALRFNFRGIGKSEGKHDEGIGESKDLLNLCQQMRDCWPDKELWLAGFSFGSWVAANSADEAGAAQLLSIAPPVNHFDFQTSKKPSCPWLIFMGEEDDVVEPDAVFNWIDNQQTKPELIRFADTGHFFHGKIVKMANLLEEHYRPLV